MGTDCQTILASLQLVCAPNGARPSAAVSWAPNLPCRRSTSLTVPPMAFFMSLLMFAPLIAPSPLITLSSGTSRGLSVNGTDRWLGIAYAQPPLGFLRFEAPVPISLPLVGIRAALKFSHACPQPPTTSLISEDCLYLNVSLRSSTGFYAIISCIHRCGGHHKLAERRHLVFNYSIRSGLVWERASCRL